MAIDGNIKNRRVEKGKLHSRDIEAMEGMEGIMKEDELPLERPDLEADM